MSRSQLVAEHLPLLRRYARALTGNQASGDAYVGAMLEALLQDPSLLEEQYGPRVALFRLFTRIWNSVSLNGDSAVTTLPLPPERRLTNITPLPRQTFLLISSLSTTCPGRSTSKPRMSRAVLPADSNTGSPALSSR